MTMKVGEGARSPVPELERLRGRWINSFDTSWALRFRNFNSNEAHACIRCARCGAEPKDALFEGTARSRE